VSHFVLTHFPLLSSHTVRIKSQSYSILWCSCAGGNALVLGRSIRTDMPAIRQHLGVCPQHDVLYPLLTAREHLRLYAALRGLSEDQFVRESSELLRDVMLDKDADAVRVGEIRKEVWGRGVGGPCAEHTDCK